MENKKHRRFDRGSSSLILVTLFWVEVRSRGVYGLLDGTIRVMEIISMGYELHIYMYVGSVDN